MDELIELVIRGIVALFEKRQTSRSAPPPMPMPRQVKPPAPVLPGSSQSAVRSAGLQQRPMLQRQAPTQKPRTLQRKTGKVLPPPLPQQLTAAPPAVESISQAGPAAGDATARSIKNAPTYSAPSITASSIRQLLQMGPKVRTMVVLTEVLQPPLALRD